MFLSRFSFRLNALVKLTLLSVSLFDAALSDTNANKCKAPAAPQFDSAIELKRAFSAFVFRSLVGMYPHPTKEGMWFVLDQSGKVLLIDEKNPGKTSVFLDLSQKVDFGGEKGLLGFALHPDFPKQSRVFVNYIAPSPLRTVIASFETSNEGLQIVPASEKLILQVSQPAGNHNGGTLAFGPDKFLYIGLGDGGGANDQYKNGQNINSLLGKMLRININKKDPGLQYAIPTQNPFVGKKGRGEIYAWGLRNPWKFSFDRSTGKLYVADVGQQRFEEVNIVERGGNYGWPIREGMHCFGQDKCDASGLIDPITEYPHTEGLSVTGGYVYRGAKIPSLIGQYLFADFSKGKIWATQQQDSARTYERTLLSETDLNIASFAQSNSGELYVLGYDGRIFSLGPKQASSPKSEIPEKLSATGCFDPKDPTQPLEMMISYEPVSPLWSDGLTKRRWLVMPDKGSIDLKEDGSWTFPAGTLFIKEFAQETGSAPQTLKRIETRFFVKDLSGKWHGYTYEWNKENTDAQLLQSGKRVPVGAQEWLIPDRSDCLSCHNSQSGRVLGMSSPQLNNFPADEALPAQNQIERLYRLGVFGSLELSKLQAFASLPNPDAAEALQDPHLFASAWLATNCSTCHRPQGTGRGNLDFRFSTLQARQVPAFCGKKPETGNLGISDASIFSPGRPNKSVLLERIKRKDANRMPPLGSQRTDPQGAMLIEKWIQTISNCD